jgi:branched-chain amino acid transport system permease protein
MLIVLVLLGLTPLALHDVAGRLIVVLAMIYAVGAIGLDLLIGYSGQFSFGQFVYFAIGAYVMTSLRLNFGVDWGWALLAAVAAATIVATAIGSIFVRLKFFGSAVGTFFLGAVALNLLNSTRFERWTGGSNGLPVEPVSIGGLSLTDGAGLYYSAFIALVISAALCLRYTKVRAGLAARVVKENEVVAAVLGIRVFREKTRAHMLAGAVGGLGGCILALDIGYLSPETFDVTESIVLFAMVAVGGTGSLVGAIIGALFFFGLINGLAATSASASQLIFAAILLVVVVVFKNGLYDLFESVFRWIFRSLMPDRWRRPSVGRATAPAASEDVSAPDMPAAGPRPQAAVETQAAPMLSIEGASVEFGGLVALKQVSLHVDAGSVHAIIGPNGAGKTTLLNCISGIQPTAGVIRLSGTDLTPYSVSQRRAEGLARTFQHPSLVGDLSAIQNVAIGAFAKQSGSLLLELIGAPSPRRLRREAGTRARDALQRLGFPRERWAVLARDLTMGEQKHVDIARAIASAPQVLLLDEPTSGLGIEEMETVERAIRIVRDAGVTVLVIAHHVGFIRRIADRCTVLNFGEVLTDGTVDQVLADRRVGEVFMGSGGVKEST